MIGVPVLALTLSLGGAVVPVSEFDVPYFLANPEIHAETLRRCHADYELARTVKCENAEAAGARRLGQPMPPLEKKAPVNNAPIGKKGKDRAT
jgi:hypothetical protein